MTKSRRSRQKPKAQKHPLATRFILAIAKTIKAIIRLIAKPRHK